MKRGVAVFALIFVGLVSPLHAAFQFTVANSDVSSTLNAVAYDGVSSFVAVGTNSTVATASLSDNELLWSSNSVPTSKENLKAVAFGGGIFVAGGATNNVFSSSNGIIWTAKSKVLPNGNNADVQELAFTAGHFIAAPAVYQAAWSDTSLSTWQAATMNNSSVVESFRAVTPLGTNGFALCGIRGDVRISKDTGQTWNTNQIFNFSAPDFLGFASSSNMLVCVGTGGTIWVSANAGTNWFTANSGTTSNLNAVAYTGPGFIAVGDGGLIVTSLDGTNWTANASPTTANLYGVAYATSGQLKDVAVLVGAGGTVVIGSIPHTLAITNFNNTTIVSWPSPAVMFTLQTNGNLATTNWGNYGGIVGDNGTNKTVTNSPSIGNLFFRLK